MVSKIIKGVFIWRRGNVWGVGGINFKENSSLTIAMGDLGSINFLLDL